jgi:hypothetical protein
MSFTIVANKKEIQIVSKTYFQLWFFQKAVFKQSILMMEQLKNIAIILIAILLLIKACEKDFIKGVSNKHMLLDLLDHCRVEISDLNDNIKALSSTIGELKEALENRRY